MTLPRPYYADEYVTLYLGDCRDILAHGVGQHIAVVTDQPYGTGWVKGGGSVGVFNAKPEREEWDRWDMSWMRFTKHAKKYVVFGPNSRTGDLRRELPNPNQLVWWRKTNPRPNGPDREPVCIAPAFLPRDLEYATYNGDTPLHPNQKPLALMIWLLGFVPTELTIVDPFAGSGTTLVAAKSLERLAIGIEQDENYCAVIADRLRQSILELGATA